MIGHDGGPAFPTDKDDSRPEKHGMTLRDYFAAHAMAVIAEHGTGPEGRDPSTQDDFVEACYSMADAMLKERAK